MDQIICDIFYDMSCKNRCNLAIKSSSSNNSLFSNVGDGSLAASIADIIEANFSNTNFSLIFATKIFPAIDISVCGDHCTIDIFEFSEKKSGAIYSFVEVKVSLITSLDMLSGPFHYLNRPI